MQNNKIKDKEDSEETDDEFEWYEEKDIDDTYFTYVNKTRRTLEPGEQVYYCYGNRNNRFLLINYGFCFPDNKYDSYELPMRVDLPFNDVNPAELIDFKHEHDQVQPIRFKIDQINETMVGYLRSCCKTSFLALQNENKTKRRILLTIC